ncbi:MAG: coproporphyrinogen III oxidase [Fusobacterium perfoetens]|uniref:coproporphyrinogen III oxidase n=1 Tax=Fusobacterium perfoetens TaxID=852 RepID=UPI0023F082D2|nr:coproporphyrinogen III oxidase [Fusobacterium perfoetens]MCI6152138.1 coproporphyrinogen III oxidase [Fusobacterium perfoetens]MDY3237971.1 coproporphyrinogen III oxidase [Fusobacterium perfoetens]
MKIKLDFTVKENTVQDFKKVLLPDVDIDILEAKTLEETKEKISIELSTNGRKKIFTLKNYTDKMVDQKTVMLKAGMLLLFDKVYPWGALVGVRPTKLIRRYLVMGYSYEEIDEILDKLYFVFPEKRKLLLDVVKKENQYLNAKGINMYVGIPYCPTRCKYCSFASYEINSKLGNFYNEFVDTLIEEIKLTGEILKNKNSKIESLYFGGGTPSILTEKDLVRVIEALYENIDLTHLKEFTFEAGREDTLNKEKLEILKRLGVDRLSLNPQTFNENILKNLNRHFDKKHFDEMFQEIKKLGFVVNMDFIIGLPGETVEDILRTFEEVKKYPIDNLTIHFLAVKNGSNLIKDKYKITEIENQKIEEKIKEVIEEKNMKPYYLYRQKNSMNWGENVGYSIEGKESIFNIEMIEENQSTVGLGGGAISKKVEYIDETRVSIERYINPKDPYMYICEMKDRMKQKEEFFSSL